MSIDFKKKVKRIISLILFRNARKKWATFLGFYGSNIIGQKPRRLFIRKILGLNAAKSVIIYRGCQFWCPKNIKIDSNTSLGHNCILDGRHGLTIGKNVNLSTQVYIWTTQHDPQDPDFAGIGAPVIIGDYAWLSCRSTILPGVIIGEGAVVAAGAVVTKDVEPYTIVGGIPAKKIGERNRNLNYKLDKYVALI